MNNYRKVYLRTPSPNKAKNDMDEIMQQDGFSNLAVNLSGKGKLARFVSKLMTIATLPFKVKNGDVMVVQYPYKKYYGIICRIVRLKGGKTVTLIHDLGTFRRHKLTDKQEIKRLSQTDYIISHNKAMTAWLAAHQNAVPVANLEIFDYLESSQPKEYSDTGNYGKIVYAGGLGIRKNAFLYAIDPYIDGCTLEIYGKGFDEEKAIGWRNVQYKGFMSSKKFVANIDGDWGLVWDGDALEACSGNWGEYLRINNPHKASFYLRAGLPIIVWKESAMADFVKNENIGLAVGDLKDLSALLAKVSPEQYMAIRQNVARMKDRLQSGHYFKKAFAAALEEFGIGEHQ